MRWIESLRNGHAMHRKRIDALWNDLQTLLNTDTAGEPLAADGELKRRGWRRRHSKTPSRISDPSSPCRTAPVTDPAATTTPL